MTAFAQMQYTAEGSSDVAKARAIALTRSPTSNIVGKTFDRFVTIWFENTDYSMAAGDPNFQYLAKLGITLTNYVAITHPSQPNYVAAVGGSTHGISNDNFHRISSDQKTIIDLLEAKGVSWGVYGEDSPYSGFQGNYVNQENGKNDYVRKHNPVISYDSVTTNTDRLAQTKNFTMFDQDLAKNNLPQWMFITPNMTNDGHDSSVTAAGNFVRSFVEPLLSNPHFMKRTLVLISKTNPFSSPRLEDLADKFAAFDETESYSSDNKVFSLLLGDAVPASAYGTTSSSSYNHYSQMATVEQNWDLGNLGLGDKDAAAFY
ncbi:related to phosphate-repressible acid phosphatase precursor [Rhynchosporium agropyri]|uniref:Related to phosphate-repressible acid phosphatase n=1 Tax=Rhynchosporium agropyri TaxID=914238 RepID=A0A1E1KJB4_9HELO|nr:related to phosphate-repressible acid phosphatase precursor [Rhynchosporium agropyri]